MDIMERIHILRDCDFSTEEDYNDLCSIIRIFTERFQISIDEENAGVMITHMAAAFRRNRTGEAIEPLGQEVYGQMKESPYFHRANEIITELEGDISNRISETERAFFLLHICMLLEEQHTK